MNLQWRPQCFTELIPLISVPDQEEVLPIDAAVLQCLRRGLPGQEVWGPLLLRTQGKVNTFLKFLFINWILILKIENQVKRHVHSTIYSLFISAIPEEVGSKMPREIWEKVWRFTQTPYDELNTYNAGLRLGLSPSRTRVTFYDSSVLCVAHFFGKRFSRGFRSLSPHFVVFIHGERDLSSLPCFGGAAVQISLKIEECRVADVISSRMTRYQKELLTPKIVNTEYKNSVLSEMRGPKNI